MASYFHDHEHDLYCDILDDGTVSITYNEDNEDYNTYSGFVYIPEEAAMGALHPQYIPITEIGKYAFRNCYDLTGVSIGGNVKNIGYDSFWGCTKLTEIDIPDNVLTIENWAFESCSAMTKITLGSGLTSIGGSAFTGCNALRTIICNATTPPSISSTTFPSTVTNSATLYVPSPGAVIAYRNANYWSSFANIVTTKNYDFVYNGIYYAITGSNTVSVTNNGGENTYSGSITIPATVTYGGKTYRVTEIGANAFRGSSNMTSVTIGSNVTIIQEWAFSYSGITSVVIPDNVQSIGFNAFGDISTLTQVTIGKGVTYIGTYAFDSPLTKVTVLATTPPTINNSNAFKSDTYNNANLIVPKGCASAYESATYWKNFKYINECIYDFYVNGIYYKKTGSNTASVCRSIDEPAHDYTGTVTIPATVTYNGTTYRVTGIDDFAFCLCTVTKVNIGSNVTTIGQGAFLISGLTSITIPNNVTSMGASAFEGCSDLKSASIGTGITTISDYAFMSTDLVSINIPNNVKTIGKEAFHACSEATSLSIGTGVTTIGEEAFNGLNITSITIPNSVTTIGKGAFYYCDNATTLTIGSGVTSIGDEAFYECNKLTSVTCNAVTPPTIQSRTFYPSSIYSNATLTVPGPSAVTAYKAANYWKNFTTINAANVYDFAVNGIYYKITGTNTVSVTYKNSSYNSYTTATVTIPANVTYGGTTYKVTAIGDNAFRKCTSVTKVNIGSNVTTIGQYAFYSSGLTSVNIPNGVTNIKAYAFGNCTNLASVIMGSGITTIGGSAFVGCTALTAINIYATTPPGIQSTTFPSSTYSNATLTVPNPSAVTAYKAANYWKNFTTIKAANNFDILYGGIYYLITGANTVSVTFMNSDYNSYTAATVTIPAQFSYNGTTYKVTAIGDNAFRKCTSVTKVNIGSNVTSIGQYAFYSSGLTSVTIPDNVTTIKVNAFGSCNNLTSVVIGKGVTTIASLAFDSPLMSVTCHAVTPPTMSNTNCFRTSTYDNATLYVPAASLASYKTASGWRYFAKILSIGGGVTGDLDGNGELDVTDITLLIDAFLNGEQLDPNIADVNGDGAIDIADLTALIDRLLNGK